MIISMSDVICITNRALCNRDFFEQIEIIASEKPTTVILREKDLSENEYAELAEQVMKICKKYDVLCILHSFTETAIRLGADGLHLPLHLLRNMTENEKKYFPYIGTSCHSLADAIEAEKLGCTYLIAGHIYSTDCKKGVPPRGLDFLSDICKTVSIPVYAIGGIRQQNFHSVIEVGAKGGCIMSGLMKCENVHEYMEVLKGE